MTDDDRLLLSYYGDDLTGSTDVMEVLEAAGLPTILYLRPPTSADAGGWSGIKAVGLAGMSRTMTLGETDELLPAAMESMAALDARIFHYKVCSTFDSSPSVGSIGRAIEIGRRRFGEAAVPVVIGAPALGRYCVFGELYVRLAGRIHRLDRHPALPFHPVTPMREADLLLHLALQTDLPSALVDVLALDAPAADRARTYRGVVDSGAAVVLLDVLTETHLEAVGELIWSVSDDPFVVGSSGVESALVAHWRRLGTIGPAPVPAQASVARAVLVLSGSCSAATASQVEDAISRGHRAIRLPTGVEATGADVARIASTAAAAIDRGQSVVIYTALGPDDCGSADRPDAGHAAIGEMLGEIAARVIGGVDGVRPRLVVAGGDTSGRVAQRLGIDALRMIAPIAPGAPLCRALSLDPAVDGLEIALKGGQLGSPAYVETVRLGRADRA